MRFARPGRRLAFGDKPVDRITKADILAFRAALAEQPGRVRETLGAKRINGILQPLRRQHAATGKLGEYVFCNAQGNPLDNKNFTDRVW